MYKLTLPSQITKKVETVIRLADKAIIPFDVNNTDYQDYLDWVNKGNEPLPASA